MTAEAASRPQAFPIHESMRIAGERIDTDERIDVHYPYDDSVIGTVPATDAITIGANALTAK